MPAPPSYIDITALPFTRVVTQAEFNGGTYGGVANEVWFRYVSSADTIFGLYVNKGGTFSPITNLYKSDGSTVITGGLDQSFWRRLNAATFYVRVTNHFPSVATDFDFTCQFAQGAFVATPFPTDAILINDDSAIPAVGPYATSPFPATVWLPDGTFLGFARDVVAGEIGDILPSGVSLWHDRWQGSAGSYLRIYHPDLTLLASTDTSPSVFGSAGAAAVCNDGTQFILVNRSNNAIYSISAAGAVATLGQLTGLGPGVVNSIGVSRDGNTLYYTVNFEEKIRRWDLSTDSALADFYTVPIAAGDVGVVGFSTFIGSPRVAGVIVVLSDDSVVTWYKDFGTSLFTIIHLDSGGSLLHSHELASGEIVNRINYSAGNPDQLNAWFFLNDLDHSQIGTYNIAAGTFSSSFTIPSFSGGISRVGGDSTIFGPSYSCALATLNTTIVIDEPDEDTGDDTVPCCADEPPGSGTDNDGKPKPPGLVPAGNPGAILPTVTPAWTITCVGLGTVPSAADLTDCESWTL